MAHVDGAGKVNVVVSVEAHYDSKKMDPVWFLLGVCLFRITRS